MSDVSGIPNMGFGGGNFFAPQFSYNPQMSAGQASAAYMPAENYAQNVTNNLFSSGGGFGRQTDYYSQLAANQLSGLTPYTFNETNAGTGMTVPQMYQTFQGGGPGGGTSLNTQAWDQSSAGPDWGPGTGFSTGGGGLFSGNANSLGGGGGGYNGPAIDWSGVGNAAAGMSAPSSAQPFDWSLFGSGGAKADPASGMAMPGGLGSPMTMPQQPAEPQQQPGINWGDVGAAAGAGSSMPYTSGIEPDQSAQTFAGGAATTDPFPGMSMPGGLNSPMTAPEPGASFGERFDASGGNAPGAPRTYDFAPMFEGGGGGFGGGGTESQTFGGNAGSLGGNVFDYIQDPSATKEAPGPSAEDMAAQGRAKLAELMGDPKVAAETAKAVEATKEAAPSPFDQPSLEEFQKGGPFDQPSLEEFQKGGPFDQPSLEQFQKGQPEASRPADKIDTSMAGRKEALDTLRKELQATGLVMTSSYRSADDKLSIANPNSKHTQALAFDTRAHTPAEGDAAMGKIRELMNARGMVEGRDYTILDEVRNKSPWATGEHIHTQMTEQGMQQYQRSAYDVNAGQVIPRPPTDIPFPRGIPTPQERPAEAPGTPFVNDGTPFGPPAPSSESLNAPRPPADIPDPRVSGGGFNALDAAASNIAGGGFNAIDAAAKHTGLELARANVDTPIEKIAMERGGQRAVDQVSSMAVGMTPRQLMQSYGGMFMSRAEPLFSSLGITRQDFEKAIAMPPTQQDIKMRVAEGFPGSGAREDDSWTPQEYTPKWNTDVYQPALGGGVQHRDETASDLRWSDFARPGNVVDRTGEQLGRDQLAALKARGFSYSPGPEAASSPLGAALGLGDLPTPRGTAASMARPQGFAGIDLTEPNPVTGQPGTSWYSETPYNYGGGLGTSFDPARDQQQQQAELQTQRAPIAAQLENNEALRNKLMATMVDEMGAGASDQDYAKVAESLFNRAAVVGNSSNLDVTGLLGGVQSRDRYYEGQQVKDPNSTVMGAKYLDKLALVQNDQALRDRLANVIQQVAAGSDLSRLSTDNASGKLASGRVNAPFNTGYGVSDFSPGNTSNPGGETFFRSDNPFGDPRGTKQLGLLNQQDTREWYRELRPYTSYPPY